MKLMNSQGVDNWYMKSKNINIENIPVVLYGDTSDKLYIFIHGKNGNKEEAAAFAEIVCSKGYQILSMDLPGHGERKNEIGDFVPWKVVPELQSIIKYSKKHWNQIDLRANSIGAWFGMQAYQDETLTKSLFVSPVLDMEQLIKDMMQRAAVTEKDLEEQKVIPTSFGETLDWNFYQYTKMNPISKWNSQTWILYADKDNLTSRQTVDDFVVRFQSKLTAVEDAEHWFHTSEQLKVLNHWIQKNS